MSKKKSSKKQPAESLTQEIAPPAAMPTTQEPEAKSGLTFAPDILDPLVSLDDAANRYIVDYKPRWLSSLKAFAQGQGIDHSSMQHSSVWKGLFKKWGAILK